LLAQIGHEDVRTMSYKDARAKVLNAKARPVVLLFEPDPAKARMQSPTSSQMRYSPKQRAENQALADAQDAATLKQELEQAREKFNELVSEPGPARRAIL
jgi:hypothetical protein